MTWTRCLYILLALLACPELLAKGSSIHTQDRYNPQHIDSLPPEIRASILHKCSEPKALHPFAEYSRDMKTIELHFEHFACDGDGAYCGPSGCLHQVWSLMRGHYHLVRSFFVPAGDHNGSW